LIAVLFSALSLLYLKTYQLKGYDINIYFNKIYSLGIFFRSKTPLKFTKRVCRMLFCILIFESLIWFLILYYVSVWWIILLDLIVNLIFLPFLLIVFHYFLYPIEFFIKKKYLSKAKKKLKNFKGIKIAITGSFGKTSTKNILKEILSQKYKVVSTPLNYNTPMGLCKTILGEMVGDEGIFIVEMGARHKGDIKELCQIVEPDIGILTSVGEQHIETFGSIDNVLATKFELCEYLSPTKVCFFDCCSGYNKKLFKKATCKKIALGKEYEIKNSKLSSKGLEFNLKSKNEELVLNTKLLGFHMSKNIAISVMVAKYLNVSNAQIQKAVENLKPTKHRLELISKGELNILDDAYNSNYEGFCEALKVLKMFQGRKIVVSPGLVELGQKQYELNFKIGKQIAKSCDYVIIMNKINKIAIKNGLKSENFNKNNIFYAQTRGEQKDIVAKLISKQTSILFENDLPDDYA